MLTIVVLLFVLSLAAAALLHAGPAAWHAIFWVFGGFAALNLLYVIFWVFVAATVDDTKPLEEKPRAIYAFGCWHIPVWLCFWARIRVCLTGEEKLPAEGRSNNPTNTATAMNFVNEWTAMEEFYVVHADTDYWPGSGSYQNNYSGILGYSAFQNNNYPFLRSSQTPIFSNVGYANQRLRDGYIGVNGSQRVKLIPVFTEL